MDASEFAQWNGSQFFKFIIEDIVCLGKLMLPRNFAAKYGNSLPGVVTLELPTGARFKVELLKNSAREIWFDKGFKEFLQHCSLLHGNVLVFRYDKKSLFHVQAFQGTGLEIEFPDKPAVEVKMEQNEVYMRSVFETSSENGDERGSNVKMEHYEDDFQQAPKLNNEKAREGVKMENVEKDSHRVKKASKGTMEKDGAEVNAEPVLRKSGRLPAEGVSKLNDRKTAEEIGDKTEHDDEGDWDEDDDDVDDVDVESIDDDSDDEDYVDIMMDDDDDDYDSDYAQAFQQKSRRKKQERASKPSNGRTSGNGEGKRGEMEEGVGKQEEGCSMEDDDEDVDEDYMEFLDAVLG